MDQNIDHVVRNIFALEPGFAISPSYEGRASKSVEISLHAVRVYEFSSARISVKGSSITCDDQVFVERVPSVAANRTCYNTGQIIGHGRTAALVAESERAECDLIEKGIFMGGNGSENYYHWMIEILPKYLCIENDPAYRDWPLLLNSSAKRISSFLDSLNLLAPQRKKIFLDPSQVFRVRRLIYIDSVCNTPFLLYGKHSPRVSDSIVRADFLVEYADRLLSALKLKGVGEANSKIFLSRHSLRRAYNEAEVFAILEPLGFRRVYFEDLSLNDQVECIRNAEIVVGPPGAEWTNLIFCRPGTKAVSWMPDISENWSGFSTLATIFDLQLEYLIYRFNFKTIKPLYRHSYTISPADVFELVCRVLNASEGMSSQKKKVSRTTYTL